MSSRQCDPLLERASNNVCYFLAGKIASYSAGSWDILWSAWRFTGTVHRVAGNLWSRFQKRRHFRVVGCQRRCALIVHATSESNVSASLKNGTLIKIFLFAHTRQKSKFLKTAVKIWGNEKTQTKICAMLSNGLWWRNAGQSLLVSVQVPSEVSHADFWQRYFYRLHQLDADEARKAALMKRADVAQEHLDLEWEDGTWGTSFSPTRTWSAWHHREWIESCSRLCSYFQMTGETLKDPRLHPSLPWEVCRLPPPLLPPPLQQQKLPTKLLLLLPPQNRKELPRIREKTNHPIPMSLSEIHPDQLRLTRRVRKLWRPMLSLNLRWMRWQFLAGRLFMWSKLKQLFYQPPCKTILKLLNQCQLKSEQQGKQPFIPTAR